MTAYRTQFPSQKGEHAFDHPRTPLLNELDIRLITRIAEIVSLRAAAEAKIEAMATAAREIDRQYRNGVEGCRTFASTVLGVLDDPTYAKAVPIDDLVAQIASMADVQYALATERGSSFIGTGPDVPLARVAA